MFQLTHKTSKMEKYSEKETGKKAFDWEKFLNTPLEKYTELSLKEAVELSERWVTCAVGNQCDIIPRDVDGNPDDLRLRRYGTRFNLLVEGMHISFRRGRSLDLSYYKEQALEILRKIEVRSNTLIAEWFHEKFIKTVKN